MGAQIDESSKLLDGLNTSKNIIVDNITSVSATSEQTAALNEVYHHAMKLDEMVKEMDGKINQFDLKN
jgi:methyl-accepting chemotaxis protein